MAVVGLVTLLVTAALPLAAATTAGAGQDDPWLALLAKVPDTAATRAFVVLNDYAAAREVIDVEGGGTEARGPRQPHVGRRHGTE